MAYITDSWETINENCAKGFAKSLYALGDLKTITLNWGGTTEQIDMEIVGFSHDDLSDGTGKAAITFFSKQLLSANYNMANTNDNTSGWAGSWSRRIWCNSDLFNALPEELQAVIREVKKRSDGGQHSIALVETNDKCWFGSAEEMSYSTGAITSTVTGQGSRYPQTKIHDSGINGSWLKKAKADGTVYNWWLRTCPTDTNKWGFVSKDGWIGYDNAANQFGVAFGFCVGVVSAVSATDDALYALTGTRMIQIADQVRRIRGITTQLTPAQIVAELAAIET
jgi:hypothetical protein